MRQRWSSDAPYRRLVGPGAQAPVRWPFFAAEATSMHRSTCLVLALGFAAPLLHAQVAVPYTTQADRFGVFHDGLFLELEPRKPIAVFPNGERLAYVSQEGELRGFVDGHPWVLQRGETVNVLTSRGMLGWKQGARLFVATDEGPREICHQVGDFTVRDSLIAFHNLVDRTLNVYWRGRSFPVADVLLATPGRLLDLVQQRAVDLGHTRWLVLDEADRLLDLGFAEEVQQVLNRLPPRRQNLLLSATFPAGVAALAESLLRAARHIDVAADADAAPPIVQRAIRVVAARRTALLRNTGCPSMAIPRRPSIVCLERVARLLGIVGRMRQK